jgi:hypothetical protein
MKMTAVSTVWAEQQEAQVYLSGADPLTYPTESAVTRAARLGLLLVAVYCMSKMGAIPGERGDVEWAAGSADL